MSSILTIYIKNLDKNPKNQLPKALLDEVEKALHAKLKQFGLRNAPPAWLGYKDWNSWAEKDAFTELLYDCYIEAIFKQLPKLQAHIKQSKDIDGLVFNNIHWFIIGRLKKNDPTGYAVAQNTKQAIQTAISQGIITANNPSKDINNKTLLAFETSNSISHGSGKDAISKALHDNPNWCYEIQLKLSTLLKSEEVKQQFCKIICQLKAAEIVQFLFKNLVDAIKQDVRAVEIPKDIFVQYDDKLIGILFDSSYEDYQSLQYRCEQIRQAIDKSEYQDRVCEQLHLVFTEFEFAVANKNDPSSLAEIARRLEIAPATFDGYMKKLRNLVA